MIIFTFAFSLILFYKTDDIFSEIKILLTETLYLLLTIVQIFFNFFISLFARMIIDRFSPNYFPFALVCRETCYLIIDYIYLDIYGKCETMGWDILEYFYI